MAATNLNIRTDSEVKKQAERIFSELGLNMSSAVNMFLKAVVRENGIPFDLKMERTLSALPAEPKPAAVKAAEKKPAAAKKPAAKKPAAKKPAAKKTAKKPEAPANPATLIDELINSLDD